MTQSKFILGETELDLSLLGEVTNSLPVAEIGDHVKDSSDEITKIKTLIETIQKTKKAEKYGGLSKWFVPGTPVGIDKLHKHREFLFAGLKYHERYFSAANRIGKTIASCYEVSLHMTGLYPDWWKGRRFNRPVKVYIAGSTNETTRNILQKEYLGEIGEFGTGMIPADLIVKTTSKSGVSNAVDMLQVRHVSGGLSTGRFKSYDQGRRAFEGEEVDVIQLDEMPDSDVYSECYTRTATTNGIIIVTATPLDGLTPLVLSFYSEADILPTDDDLPNVVKVAREEHREKLEEKIKNGEASPLQLKTSKAVVFAGWDDAPWLTEEAKVRILAACPPHLRQARSTGVPGDTGGMVFPLPMSEITVDDFPIPNHWKLLNGIDPGWHNTGALFGAIDPDSDTLYIYADYKQGNVQPVVNAEAVKTKSKWADAPVIFDYAGMGGRKEEDQIRTIYKKHGLKLINADKSVEAGIAEVWERMSTGRLKIFRSCREFLKELATYSRDDKGKIIRVNNHCCDVVRYMCMGIKHARLPGRSMHSTQNFGRMRGNLSGRRYY